jgi:hypothetical protein
MKERKTKVIFGVMGIAAVLSGLGSCTSITANASYALPVAKAPNFDTYPYGGVGFGTMMDVSSYMQFNFDYYPFVKTGPEAEEAQKMGAGFFLKYPFELGAVTLSPMAGLNVGVGGLAAGAGIDVPITGGFFFRAETLYDFGGLGQIGESGTLFVRAGIGYKFDWGGLAPSADRTESLVSDELLVKSSSLVFDAGRSLGMTADELRAYWRAAELYDLTDIITMINYPDLVSTTMFFMTNGKATAVNYSFGNYNAVAELNLKLAFLQRFGEPARTTSEATYWVIQASGVMVFSLGKEKYPDAESGYILTLVCSRP